MVCFVLIAVLLLKEKNIANLELMFFPFILRSLSKLGFVGWVMMTGRGSSSRERGVSPGYPEGLSLVQLLISTSCFSPGVGAYIDSSNTVELSRKPSGFGYILVGWSAQVLLWENVVMSVRWSALSVPGAGQCLSVLLGTGPSWYICQHPGIFMCEQPQLDVKSSEHGIPSKMPLRSRENGMHCAFLT